jgi:hypothetical protein
VCTSGGNRRIWRTNKSLSSWLLNSILG